MKVPHPVRVVFQGYKDFNMITNIRTQDVRAPSVLRLYQSLFWLLLAVLLHTNFSTESMQWSGKYAERGISVQAEAMPTFLRSPVSSLCSRRRGYVTDLYSWLTMSL